ncbi:TonB-dependent receptor [Sphingobium sp.]|uniref:TonB-dependent receptor n=1 Tax=Sphingobium TaxID=165695 RepID=UPI001A328383|nr:TonB-dependent receptor [Sphingobium sp.]MBJ7375887.1 TonB-dependent receptor [Sphingobium sp.]
MRFHRFMLGASALAFILSVGPALAAYPQGIAEPATPDQAATAPQDVSSTDNDIVVTALFRSQRLQDTPIAITALDARALEARGQASVTDIAASAPNVTIQQSSSGFGNAAAISIRGIGQYDTNFALEPGVGVYIDDVYYPTIFGSAFDLLDLSRVEILRGPQGTLAGKNSIGGAIKLYSKKPDGEGGGFVEAVYGRFNRIDLRAAANITLVPDALFVRISGALKNRDGYVTRYDYGCRNPASGYPANRSTNDCRLGTEGGQDYQGIRAALRWLAAPGLEINVIGDYSKDDSEPSASRLIAGATPFKQQFATGEKFVNYSSYVVPSVGFSAPPQSLAKSHGISGTIDYELSPDIKLTSITAYRKTTGAYSNDGDLSPAGGSLTIATQRFATFTQELRLNGSFGDVVDYTVGGYYFRGRGFLGGRNHVGTDVSADTHITVVDFVQGDNINSSSKSAFLHSVFHLADGLNASAGVRYTDEKKTYAFRRVDPVTGGPAALVGGLDGVTANPPYTNSRWDYRLNVDYRWSPDLLTYATVSTGFKGGGINPRPFTPAQAAPFQPETLTAYEIGAKSDLLDRRLRLNLSAFFNDYRAIQITTFGPYAGFPLSARPENAGRAHVKGIELETTIVPTDGFAIDGSVSYLDFKYKALTAGALAAGITRDMVNSFTPKWKASLGAQYEIASAVGTFTPRLDVNYQSSFFTNALNAATNHVSNYTIMNGRIAFRPDNSSWEAAVAVTNLANKYYYVNIFDNLTQPAGTAAGTVGRPREWSVMLKRTF